MFARIVSILPGLALLGGTLVAPSLKADEFEKKTTVTVNEPLQLPHTVLQPGKYVFRLMDNPDRHIVLIYTGDGTRFLTRELAIPNQRLHRTGKTEFQFWETPVGQPKALRAWFYPGDNFGQEFAYPKLMATEIAKVTHTPVLSTTAEKEAEFKNAPVFTIDEGGKETPFKLGEPLMAKNEPPAEPAPQPAAQSQATPPPAPVTLPHTASPYPLIGLIGLASLAASGFVSRLSKRR
jgi:hypothetical protein